MTIHLMAAVAEMEAKAISDRTKAALTAAKARGVQFGLARPGHWEGREEARTKGLVKARNLAAEKITQAAEEAYADIVPMMTELRQGGSTLQAIADALNVEGHTTRRGATGNQVQIKRALDRPIG